MKNIIVIILAAIAFATYSMPFAKISKWGTSIPLMIIGGAFVYMLYMSLVEKVDFLAPAPYSTKQLLPYLIGATILYALGFITFGRLLLGPTEVVQQSVSSVTALIPVFALLVPALIQQQMISLRQVAGLALVVIGVYFINTKSG